MIVGGLDQSDDILNDMWLCDTTTMLWKKVLFLAQFCVHKQPLYMNEINSEDDYNCLVLMNLLCHKFRNNTCNEAKMVQN